MTVRLIESTEYEVKVNKDTFFQIVKGKVTKLLLHIEY